MMDACIYILSDGDKTKIGITTDFKKRISGYVTHNANAQVHRRYPCDVAEAKRVESAIKLLFKKDLVPGKSKEWFLIDPHTVDKYVSVLLERPRGNATRPSLHGVPVTKEAQTLKDRIVELVGHVDIQKRQDAAKAQAKLAGVFASCFDLGMPAHLLPENVVVKDRAGVDLTHSTAPRQSQLVRAAVRSNAIEFLHGDHLWYFYRLLRLESGYSVAVCRAVVSMPYAERITHPGAMFEIRDTAIAYGWELTSHSEWSWHHPEKTALFLYEAKTPFHSIRFAWDRSFRKWLIERRVSLSMERFSDMEMLTKAIDDSVYDNTFPLAVQSYEEFRQHYLDPIWGGTDEGDGGHWLQPAYEFLFARWNAERFDDSQV